MLAAAERRFVEDRPVAHLGTADAAGKPHVVPVCFAYLDECFYIAIDEKPKRSLRLKRLRNIDDNPQVALVFDRYDDDWTQLGWVLYPRERDGHRRWCGAHARDRKPSWAVSALSGDGT